MACSRGRLPASSVASTSSSRANAASNETSALLLITRLVLCFALQLLEPDDSAVDDLSLTRVPLPVLFEAPQNPSLLLLCYVSVRREDGRKSVQPSIGSVAEEEPERVLSINGWYKLWKNVMERLAARNELCPGRAYLKLFDDRANCVGDLRDLVFP